MQKRVQVPLRRLSFLPAFSTLLPSTLMAISPGLAQLAQKVLTSADPLEKVRLTHEAVRVWSSSRTIGPLEKPPQRPARPEKPLIVPAGDVPTAKQSGAPKNVYYLHSLAHVELNAIDLCFDTMLRFAEGTCEAPGGMEDWFADWISVADDEARHFSWLEKRLRELGSSYGALPAHGIIWEGADASRGSRRDRVAAGQLVAEARGLDAGPRLADRLLGTGDKSSAAIVRVIADEEIRHVQVGVKWFMWECERVGLDVISEFHDIAIRLGNPGAFAPPFNEERRLRAGMAPEWYLPVAEIMTQMRSEQRERRKNASGEDNVGSEPMKAVEGEKTYPPG